jgi:hypothetical protein
MIDLSKICKRRLPKKKRFNATFFIFISEKNKGLCKTNLHRAEENLSSLRIMASFSSTETLRRFCLSLAL